MSKIFTFVCILTYHFMFKEASDYILHKYKICDFLGERIH